MMKKCTKCGERKPSADFYTKTAQCKECIKQRVRKYRADNLERCLIYDRQRNMLPHRVQQRNEYAQTEHGRAMLNKGKIAWIKRNPEKRRTHFATWIAIRNGKLIKRPCEICGELKAHAHHEDYSKPLEVRWLCPRHHVARHREIS